MRKMKIAFLVEEFPSLSETFILDQITGLIDMGHELEVFAITKHDGVVHPDVDKYRLGKRTSYYCPLSPGVRIAGAAKKGFKQLRRSPGCLIASLDPISFRRNALNLKLLYAMDAFDGKSYDIIQCHYGTIGNIGAFLKYIGQQGKLVTMFHGCDLRYAQQNGGKVFKPLFRLGDCFLAISRYSAAVLQGLGADPQKIVIHPVGIDVGRFPFRDGGGEKSSGDTLNVLTVGRLVEEKGIAYGIRAVGKVVERNPSLRVRYSVVGEGEQLGTLVRLAETLGLTDVIEFLGGMDQPGVIRMLQEADIFLLPSVAEVLPVSLMEAQAVGLPVVATAVGGVMEVLSREYARFVAPPGDTERIAGSIESLLDNRRQWRELRESGRRHVEENFDVRVLNKRLEALYLALLEG